MDKIFDVEIDGQVTLPDGSTLGPLEETTVNVVQPSEGGGGAMVVNIIIDEETLTITADKTFDEIKNAAPNVVVAFPDPDLGNQYLTMTACGDNMARFTVYLPEENDSGGYSDIVSMTIVIQSNNTVDLYTGTIEVS